MGLSMYVSKRTKNDNSNFPEELFFWGKYGFILDWFKKNVIGLSNKATSCQLYPFSEEKIKELRDISKTILDDPSKAKDLLPINKLEIEACPKMAYTKLYFNVIEHTYEELSEVLEFTDFDKEEILFWFSN